MLETASTAVHAAELDAAGVIGGGDRAWMDHVAPHARRDIGPAKLTLEDGWVEIGWKEIPTSDPIARAADLLATLATGAGPAYR